LDGVTWQLGYIQIIYTLYTRVGCKSRIITGREASSSDTAFPTDETWYKQLYIRAMKVYSDSDSDHEWMTWHSNTFDVNYSPSLLTFLQIINSMKLTRFFLCFIIKMLDKRIICTKCMYNCLYHVSSVGKAVSLLDASRPVMIRLLQPTRVYNV
jgi:hypothetical protein